MLLIEDLLIAWLPQCGRTDGLGQTCGGRLPGRIALDRQRQSWGCLCQGHGQQWEPAQYQAGSRSEQASDSAHHDTGEEMQPCSPPWLLQGQMARQQD